jgi:hypothetical protein
MTAHTLRIHATALAGSPAAIAPLMVAPYTMLTIDEKPLVTNCFGEVMAIYYLLAPPRLRMAHLTYTHGMVRLTHGDILPVQPLRVNMSSPLPPSLASLHLDRMIRNQLLLQQSQGIARYICKYIYKSEGINIPAWRHNHQHQFVTISAEDQSEENVNNEPDDQSDENENNE